jgi:hypothetical protein
MLQYNIMKRNFCGKSKNYSRMASAPKFCLLNTHTKKKTWHFRLAITENVPKWKKLISICNQSWLALTLLKTTRKPRNHTAPVVQFSSTIFMWPKKSYLNDWFFDYLIALFHLNQLKCKHNREWGMKNFKFLWHIWWCNPRICLEELWKNMK